MQRRAFLALAVALCLALPAAAQAGWNEPWAVSASDAGVSTDPTANSLFPSMTVADGVPYVAWQEGASDGNVELRVARYDGSGWVQPWPNVSAASGGFNRMATNSAANASMATVGGVPYVAYVETDDIGIFEVRVQRLAANGTTWEEPWDGASAATGGINILTNKDAQVPQIADVGGVPYVAWIESDNTNAEVRVKRLSGNAWVELDGATATDGGVNVDTAKSATDVSITDVGGVPYVAWIEPDAGGNNELRVAFYDSVADDWDEPSSAATASGGGINQRSDLAALNPTIADVGGVPYVSWQETDTFNFEVRVARLEGDAWKQPWTGVSNLSGGVNTDSSGHGQHPHMTVIAGRPYIAWSQSTDVGRVTVARLNATGTGWEVVDEFTTGGQRFWIAAAGGVPLVAWDSGEIHIARLEPEFGTASSFPSATGAILLQEVQAFGVEYPIGFEFGPGSGFGTEAAPVTTTYASDTDTVYTEIGGLSPSTLYSWRAFGTDLTRRTAVGTTSQFTTAAAPATSDTGTGDTGGTTSSPAETTPVPTPAPTPVPPNVTQQPVTVVKLLVAVVQPRLTARTGRRIAVSYLATAPGRTTLEVRLRGRRVARVVGSARTGRNRIIWNGKIRRRIARRGRYALVLTTVGTDAQRATDRGTLVLR